LHTGDGETEATAGSDTRLHSQGVACRLTVGQDASVGIVAIQGFDRQLTLKREIRKATYI
jgi:hypothetical protein